jgi:hypothetical protein
LIAVATSWAGDRPVAPIRNIGKMTLQAIATLTVSRLQHEPIAAITQLGHAEIPRIVGAAETRKKLLNHLY